MLALFQSVNTITMEKKCVLSLTIYVISVHNVHLHNICLCLFIILHLYFAHQLIKMYLVTILTHSNWLLATLQLESYLLWGLYEPLILYNWSFLVAMNKSVNRIFLFTCGVSPTNTTVVLAIVNFFLCFKYCGQVSPGEEIIIPIVIVSSVHRHIFCWHKIVFITLWESEFVQMAKQ